jgi:hypothetical protein
MKPVRCDNWAVGLAVGAVGKSALLCLSVAIVASEAHHFALGCMYQNYFELEKKSSREVRVFNDLIKALLWLGREEA